MTNDRQRTQREALADVTRGAVQPETSGERTRARAWARYLAAEFKRVTKPTQPPARDSQPDK